jgi:hypothetical protein
MNPETIKLSVWVIGVGLVHAAAIALVLPMLITLPAPGGTESKVEVVDVELVPAAQLKPRIELDVDQTAALPSSPEPDTAGAEAAAPAPVDGSLQAAPEPKEEPAAEPVEESAIGPAGEPAAKPAEEATSQPTDESATFPTAAPDPVANLEPEATPAPTPVAPQGAPTIGSLESEPSAAPIEQVEPKSKAPVPNLQRSKSPRREKPRRKGTGLRQRRQSQPPKSLPSPWQSRSQSPCSRTSQDVQRKGLVPFKGSWRQLLGGPTPVPAKR